MVKSSQTDRKLMRKQGRQMKKQKKAQHFSASFKQSHNSDYSQKTQTVARKSYNQTKNSQGNTKGLRRQKQYEEEQDQEQCQEEEMDYGEAGDRQYDQEEDEQFQEYEGEGGLLEEMGGDDFDGFYEEGQGQHGGIDDDHFDQQQDEQFYEQQDYQDEEYQQNPQMQVEEHEDDKLIKYYEQKLNKAGSKNYQKLSMKENGFDQDFFSFLDDISHKVKKGGKIKQSKLRKAENTEESKQKKSKKKQKKQSKPQLQPEPEPQEQQINSLYPKQSQKLRVELPPVVQTQKQKQQELLLRKSLNSLLNKVSDGNILKISREINTIFMNNAKSKVFTCFHELFVKSAVENPRIQSHILAANIALTCGLHHLYDNQFFAPLVSKVVSRFDQLQKTEEVIQKTQDELQLNPVLQKKKNCLKIFCYMYMLNSLTIDFIKEFFFEFTTDISHSNIQLLYLLVTTVGSKIRSDDPKTLKDIIQYIQSQIGQSKNQGYQENNKVKFILHELNQLKLNKKCLVDPDQRFNFLVTFIKKNVLQENALAAKIYLLTLKQTREKDKNTGFWWEPSMIHSRMEEEDQEEQEGKNKQLNEETRYLEDLARQQKMVTEKKKKIFIAIMKSEDYIEATENILMLKIKNQSQIAEVIVEICSQEKTFNSFYVYLASKLIECSIRFKNAFKFAIWNHTSQFQNYTFRKISNLAKFTTRLIILSSECSLAFFKNLGDFMSLEKFNQIFFMIALQEFFQNVSMQRMSQLLTKIRVGDNNKDFKRNLQQYLEEDYYKYCKEGKKEYKDKVKIAIRLLKIEDKKGEDEEDQRN